MITILIKLINKNYQKSREASGSIKELLKYEKLIRIKNDQIKLKKKNLLSKQINHESL